MTKMTAEMFGANTPIVPDETLEEWLRDEPVKKMTQKELIQKQIEDLQTALKILESEENRRTPCEKAYRDDYGEFPITDSMSGGDKDYIAWDAFQKGWEAWNEYPKPSMINCVLEGCPPEGYVTWHEWFNEMGSRGILHNLRISSTEYKNVEDLVKNFQEKDWKFDVKTDLKPHWEPKPQELEEVEEGLREAFREAVKQGVVSSSQNPKTLWRRFYDEKWSDSACDEFCEIVEQWLSDNTTTVDEDYYTVTLKLRKGMIRSEK